MSYFTETFNFILEDGKASELGKDFVYGATMGIKYGGVMGGMMAARHPRQLTYKAKNGKEYHGDSAFNRWWNDILVDERGKDGYKSLSAMEKYKLAQRIQKATNDACDKAVASKQYDLNKIKIKY